MHTLTRHQRHTFVSHIIIVLSGVILNCNDSNFTVTLKCVLRNFGEIISCPNDYKNLIELWLSLCGVLYNKKCFSDKKNLL